MQISFLITLYLASFASLLYLTSRSAVTNIQMAILTMAPLVANTLVMYPFLMVLSLRDDGISYLVITLAVTGVALGQLLSIRAVQAPHIIPRLMGAYCGSVFTILISFLVYQALYEMVLHGTSYQEMEDRHSVVLSIMAVVFLFTWAIVTWRLWGRDDFTLLASRMEQNICIVCCYDLRGLPPGASCPECGQAARKPEQKPATTPAGPGDKPAPSI